MNSTEFTKLLDKVEQLGIETNLHDILSNSLKSMAEFFNIGEVQKNKIPLTAVQLYLEEKKLPKHLEKINTSFVDEKNAKYNLSEYQKELESVLLEKEEFIPEESKRETIDIVVEEEEIVSEVEEQTDKAEEPTSEVDEEIHEEEEVEEQSEESKTETIIPEEQQEEVLEPTDEVEEEILDVEENLNEIKEPTDEIEEIVQEQEETADEELKLEDELEKEPNLDQTQSATNEEENEVDEKEIYDATENIKEESLVKASFIYQDRFNPDVQENKEPDEAGSIEDVETKEDEDVDSIIDQSGLDGKPEDTSSEEILQIEDTVDINEYLEKETYSNLNLDEFHGMEGNKSDEAKSFEERMQSEDNLEKETYMNPESSNIVEPEENTEFSEEDVATAEELEKQIYLASTPDNTNVPDSENSDNTDIHEKGIKTEDDFDKESYIVKTEEFGIEPEEVISDSATKEENNVDTVKESDNVYINKRKPKKIRFRFGKDNELKKIDDEEEVNKVPKDEMQHQDEPEVDLFGAFEENIVRDMNTGEVSNEPSNGSEEREVEDDLEKEIDAKFDESSNNLDLFHNEDDIKDTYEPSTDKLTNNDENSVSYLTDGTDNADESIEELKNMLEDDEDFSDEEKGRERTVESMLNEDTYNEINSTDSSRESKKGKRLDIGELLEHKEMTKIIETVFDYDIEEFSNTLEEIVSCKSLEDAYGIINRSLKQQGISRKSKEAESFKQIVSGYFDRR